MDAASRVAFFVDRVAWLECTHCNLRIPIPSKGPLVDVGAAYQDILVIKDLKNSSYVISVLGILSTIYIISRVC